MLESEQILLEFELCECCIAQARLFVLVCNATTHTALSAQSLAHFVQPTPLLVHATSVARQSPGRSGGVFM
jgi:hypothetical protein